MYARQVNGKELNFAVSGMLWRRSLVMIDRETESLWSHLLGEAMEGELEGTKLETLPAVITTWEAWKAAHPETTVLAMSRTAREFVKEFHEKPGKFVLGLRSLGQAKAYPFETLMKTPVINDTFQGEPIVVLYDPEGTGGRAFSRKLGDRTLTFEKSGDHFTDQQSKSMWNRRGRCVEGDLKGEQLEEIPAIPSFAKAWKQFYPKTEIFGKE